MALLGSSGKAAETFLEMSLKSRRYYQKKLLIKIKRNYNNNDQMCALTNLKRRIRNNQRQNKPLQIFKLGSFQFQGRIVRDTDVSKEIRMSRDKD
jgi:hypothetical protein